MRVRVCCDVGDTDLPRYLLFFLTANSFPKLSLDRHLDNADFCISKGYFIQIRLYIV